MGEYLKNVRQNIAAGGSSAPSSNADGGIHAAAEHTPCSVLVFDRSVDAACVFAHEFSYEAMAFDVVAHYAPKAESN